MLVQNLLPKYLAMVEHFVESARIFENVAFDVSFRSNHIPLEIYRKDKSNGSSFG